MVERYEFPDSRPRTTVVLFHWECVGRNLSRPAGTREAMASPHPGPRSLAGPGRSLAHILAKSVLLILVAAVTAVVSVVASAWGLSSVLVVVAVVALVAVTIRQRARGDYTPYQSRKALLIAGLAIIGFFIVISVVGAYWPK
jgi:hypothetical protein